MILFIFGVVELRIGGYLPCMKIVLATRNAGKVAEIKALLATLDVEICTVADFVDAPTVEEDRDTLEGNALKKARALHAHTGLPTLADDTGLEVDALGGRPGVYSARYAGPEEDPIANRALLLRELEGRSNRTACFRTVIAFVGDGEDAVYQGVCNGSILEYERGTGGFGYDSLFVPEGEQRTFAELTAEQKNKISHRGRALIVFRAALAGRLEKQ